ncbi:MAG: hypothetical protein HQ488_04160 [Parcubacteria group bacterium]|nr:hypothetical protein [Parcubacteria group bacterium]
MNYLRALLFSVFVIILVMVGVGFPYLLDSFFGYFGNPNGSDVPEWGSLIVLTVTAYIVWEYTKAAQKSNDIQERPMLNLDVQYLDSSNINPVLEFRLKNVGFGPAYNIQISPLKGSLHVYEPIFKKEPGRILEPRVGDQKVNFNIVIPNEGYGTDSGGTFFAHMLKDLFPRDADQKDSGVWLVNYSGVGGQQFYSIFRFYPEVLIFPLVSLRVEFIRTGKGGCTIGSARRICREKEIKL